MILVTSHYPSTIEKDKPCSLKASLDFQDCFGTFDVKKTMMEFDDGNYSFHLKNKVQSYEPFHTFAYDKAFEVRA